METVEAASFQLFLGRAQQAFLGRAAQFMVLAFLQSTAEIYCWSLVSSVFLARVGADALPFYYLLFAAITVPVSMLYSGVIDRWPRTRLFQVILAAFAVLSGGLALVADLGVWGCYAAYLGVSIAVLMIYSTYYVLFADHFTVTEAKHLNGPVAAAMAAGGFAGGGLVALVSAVTTTHAALLAMPVLVLAVLAHAIWLGRRERPLGEPESAAEEGIVESLRLLPKIARRYPIASALALAMFVNIFLQCLNEYLAFTIYARTYHTEAALTAFLGLTSAGLYIFGVLLAFLFTDRLLPRLGVQRMNLFFPLFNLAAFVSVAVWGRLPSGILAHIAYDPCEHSLDVPVLALVYNAVPHRFVGRVRVVNDGIVYPLALAAAGVLLMVLQHRVALDVVAAIGAALSLVLLAIHWSVGRYYVRGLLDMLRQGSITFSQVGEGLRLPKSYTDDVHRMLRSDAPDTVALGLEMAVRLDEGLTSADLGRALPAVPSLTARRLLGSIPRAAGRDTDDLLRTLLASPHARVRALALEYLAVHRTLPADLGRFLADPDEGVRAVAAAAVLSRHPDDAAAQAALQGPLAEDSAVGAICVLASAITPAALDSLRHLGRHPKADVRREALEAAAQVAPAGDAAALAWAEAALADSGPGVAAAAAALLLRTTPAATLLPAAEACLAHAPHDVRRACVRALAARGQDAIGTATLLLRSPSRDTRFTAIEALGKIGGGQAEQALFALLEEKAFPAVERNLRLEKQVPAGRPGWQPLALAIADSNARIVALVLQVLGALDCRRTVTLVRTMLKTSDVRMRANAVETLASMPLRRYILPLLPILERDSGEAAAEGGQTVRDPRAVLEAALAADDQWIAAAAVMAWHSEFGTLPALPPSPLASDTARALAADLPARHYEEDAPMNRLLFLKSLPLFAAFTLDNLMDVDAALGREVYLPGETIVTEGEMGETLYIVFRGAVSVRKHVDDGEHELARLGVGQLFGEMGLFDGEPRSASVVALEEVEMLTLDSARFNSLIQQRPDVLMELCRVLIGRLRKAVRGATDAADPPGMKPAAIEAAPGISLR